MVVQIKGECHDGEQKEVIQWMAWQWLLVTAPRVSTYPPAAVCLTSKT